MTYSIEPDVYSTRVRFSFFFIHRGGGYATGFQLTCFRGIIHTNGRFRH